jgi:hypothetical protein
MGIGLACLLAVSASALAGIEFEAIHRADVDGTDVEVVLPSNVAEGRGVLALDEQSMFWMGGTFESDFGNFMYLRRAGLDGSNVQELLGPTAIGDIAIDTAGARLYLTPQSDCAPGCTSIIRTSLDGTNAEVLFPAGFPEAMAILPEDELVCWTDWAFGDDFEQVVACGVVGEPTGHPVLDGTPAALAIDPAARKVYWSTSTEIRRANLDGSGIEDLVLGLDQAVGLAIDPPTHRMWWTERDLGKIQRASMDGQGVSDVLTGLERPTKIGFVRPGGGPDKLYWLSVAPPEDVPATSTPGWILLAMLLVAVSGLCMRR